jgi:chemotaxis protein CheC
MQPLNAPTDPMADPMTDPMTDRLTELTNIGAGHAATAFSQLAGSTILTSVPTVVVAPPQDPGVAPEPLKDGWSTGVFFELEGCLDALVAILFRGSVRDDVVRRVLGTEPGEELTRDSVEAVVMELGNIMVSRVASAIADTLGARLLPSIPVLAMEGGEEELADLIAQRSGDHLLRVECEFGERGGRLGGMLVVVPTLPSAPPSGSR